VFVCAKEKNEKENENEKEIRGRAVHGAKK
jgi:hypothetical protein